ncbi:hypothetical protein ACHAQA_005514 [Verticillium albo-atrum]
MTKELLTVKAKPRGPVNYWPFEDVDDVARREVEKFQVTPFGQIHNCCAHIPYNSGKKDFYEKTGRESFEVFKYEFRVPGVDAEYTVMWDYNVGLVRMTPFFKCCKYGKTVPAKMLNLNTGLKDITHSITGGSISAQGAPDFQRMVINPRIIHDAQHEAELSRRDFQQALASSNGYTSSPTVRQVDHRPIRPIRPMRDVDRRPRDNTRLLSPYSTDTDAEGHISGPDSASSPGSGPLPYGYHHHHHHHHPLPPASAQHTSGWTAANHRHPVLAALQQQQQQPPAPQLPQYPPAEDTYQPPSRWLSAVPRFAPPQPPTYHHHHHHHNPPRSEPAAVAAPRSTWPTKRPIDDGDDDDSIADIDAGYEGGESQNGSPALKYIAEKRREEDAPGVDPAEKNAALLLMNLSVQDRVFERPSGRVQKQKQMRTQTQAQVQVQMPGGGKEKGCVSDPDADPDAHRAKRRRATSLPPSKVFM